MGLVNDILNAGIFAGPEPPRDSWSLGTVSGAPAAGLAAVILDGDVVATSMPYTCPCRDNDRVLTVLLGRSRIVVATLADPAAALVTALLSVDGAGSGLDADKLDGQEGSYYAPAFAGSVFTAIKVLTGTLTVDGAGQKTVTVVHGLTSPTSVLATLGDYSLTSHCIINSVRAYISGSNVICSVNVATYIGAKDIAVTFLVMKS